MNISTIVCKFGGAKIVQASYVSPERVQCITPAVATAGVTSVSVALNGMDFSNEIQYQYLPHPVVTGVEPRRGPLGGNTTIKVLGQGFTPSDRYDPENILCRFGPSTSSPVTRGHYLSPTAVECATVNGTALSSLDVQVVSLQGAGLGKEVQAIEIEALPNAQEVQSIVTSAWGTQQEVCHY